MMVERTEKLYGLLAEFRTADELLHAAHAARAAGYREVEAYAPFPVEGLSEAVGMRGNAVAPAALAGGILGGIATYFMQWYAAVVSYPFNVGGRPLHSWPSFVPATFEVTILGAALAAVGAMIFGNRLPRLHHPLFGVRDFDLATRNRFFLCLRAGESFDVEAARSWLGQLQPLKVCEVPA